MGEGTRKSVSTISIWKGKKRLCKQAITLIIKHFYDHYIILKDVYFNKSLKSYYYISLASQLINWIIQIL